MHGPEPGTETGSFFGGRPGRRFTGVVETSIVGLAAALFVTSGVETATGRILGRPELRFAFPENASKSLSEEVAETTDDALWVWK